MRENPGLYEGAGTYPEEMYCRPDESKPVNTQNVSTDDIIMAYTSIFIFVF